MKIEAVTVCVNYSKQLAQALRNKEFLDRWVVVTSSEDHDTISLCADNDIKCRVTDCFFDDGASFAKGRGINKGLEMLYRDNWLLHMDADILLPHDFREIVLDLDEQCMYGSVRYHHDGTPNEEVTPAGMVYGFKKMRYICGYFQLWHSSNHITYPQDSEDARWDDLDHMHRWPMTKRHFLPLRLLDIDGYHNMNHEGVT